MVCSISVRLAVPLQICTYDDISGELEIYLYVEGSGRLSAVAVCASLLDYHLRQLLHYMHWILYRSREAVET